MIVVEISCDMESVEIVVISIEVEVLGRVQASAQAAAEMSVDR